MGAFLNDIKISTRQLLKSPGFTAVAVLTLALGIGANTAVFGLLNSVLLRPLPVRNPHELRGVNWVGDFTPDIWGRVISAPNGKQMSNTFSYPAYCEFRDHGTGTADVFAFFELGPLNSSTAIIGGQASRVNALMVSGNFFSGLGLEPALGRMMTPEDDRPNAAPAVVVSYRAWKKHFGGDPGAIGQEIVLDQGSATVVGVLPKGFLGVERGRTYDFYLPLSLQPQVKGICELESADLWWVQVMARLKPSVDESRVSHSLETLLARAIGGTETPDLRVTLTDGSGGLSAALLPRLGVMAKPLYLLFGLVGVVLLVTCINLAGLLLARGTMRQHEFSVRAALGATRRRLIRQSLTESIVLAGIGGICGFLLAGCLRPILAGMLWPSDTTVNLQSDRHVYGFMLAIVAGTTILFGLLPALRMARTDPAARLKHRTSLGAPRMGLNKVLISLQVGLSLLLLVGAGLFVRTLVNIQRIEAGFDTENLLVFRADVGQRQTEFCANLGALPGVRAVAHSNLPLLTGARSNTGIALPDDPSETLSVLKLSVAETFLSTMGIPLLAGRDFRPLDAQESQEAIIVNRALAQAAFPDGNPIGQFLKIHQQEYRIVGVCGDTKYYDLKTACEPTVFFPAHGGANYAVRAAADPEALVRAVRTTLAGLDPSIAMSDAKTLETQISENVRQERCFAWLASSLAFLAVLQSCLGLYGLLAYNVAHRTSELGIRMALGATPGTVAWPVLREALLLSGIGIAIGLPAAMALVRVTESLIYGIQPRDPVTMITSTLALIAVAVVAAWLPARRAAKTDPMEALRYE